MTKEMNEIEQYISEREKEFVDKFKYLYGEEFAFKNDYKKVMFFNHASMVGLVERIVEWAEKQKEDCEKCDANTTSNEALSDLQVLLTPIIKKQ